MHRHGEFRFRGGQVDLSQPAECLLFCAVGKVGQGKQVTGRVEQFLGIGRG